MRVDEGGGGRRRVRAKGLCGAYLGANVACHLDRRRCRRRRLRNWHEESAKLIYMCVCVCIYTYAYTYTNTCRGERKVRIRVRTLIEEG